jgi:hypothetical protein
VLLSIDEALLEVFEVLPAGAACIDDGGDADAEGKAIRGNAVVACVGATFADPVVDVDVKINEARCDVEALDVDGLESIPNSRCGARP